MLTTLFESGAKRKRSKTGLAASVAIHGVLIAAAIAAGSHVASTQADPLKAENIEYVAPPPPKPDPVEKVYEAPKAPKPKPAVAKPRPAAPRMRAPKPAPRQAAAAPAPAPINVPVISAPISVPTGIPKPDLNAIPTVGDVVARASDVAGTSAAGNASKGSSSGATTESTGDVVVGASQDDGSAWSENQVDRAVQVTRPVAPKYPDMLRSANITGVVMMRFVVGANGRVEMGTVQAIDSPHKQFTEAVKDALRHMRFRPAEVRGTKVRQLVEQSFTFRLN